MSDQEILKVYEGMQKVFGDRLPDFEVFPKQFAYYLKLYRYYYDTNKV